MDYLRKHKINFYQLILMLGIGLRIYFCFFKDFNFDGYVFTQYIHSNDPTSLFWPNYPPLYLTLAKIWQWLWGPSEFSTRGLIGLLHLSSYFLMWNFFRKKNSSLFIQWVMALFPASLYAATTVSPIALLEFEGVCVFLLFQSQAGKMTPLRALIAAILGIALLGTSYTGFLMVVYGALMGTLYMKKPLQKFLLFLGIFVLGLSVLPLIGWSSLGWIHADSFAASTLASFQAFYAFSGYSWINSAILIGLAIGSGLKGDQKPLQFYGLFLILIFLTNISLGLRANEPRFFIYWVPFFLFATEGSIRYLEFHRLGQVIKLTLVGFFLQSSLWFTVAARSGLNEAFEKLTVHPARQTFTFGFHRFIDEKFKSLATTSLSEVTSGHCEIALIWPTNALEAIANVTEWKKKNLLETEVWQSQRPSLDPVEIIYFQANSSEELCR